MIFDIIPKEWEKINKKEIQNNLRELYKSKFIKRKENYDGSINVSLTERGKLRALNLRFKNLKNIKSEWDKRWRIVAFDIPEKYKKGRSALRYRLKAAGFYEFQKSIFLYPYNCEKEIADFIKLFKMEKYVRFGLLEFIDNEGDIKKVFEIK